MQDGNGTPKILVGTGKRGRRFVEVVLFGDENPVKSEFKFKQRVVCSCFLKVERIK